MEGTAKGHRAHRIDGPNDAAGRREHTERKEEEKKTTLDKHDEFRSTVYRAGPAGIALDLSVDTALHDTER